MELHKLKDVSRFFNKTLMFLSLLFISSNLAINFSPQPRFSFFAQHSNQNFIANMEYRYEENDINHLLRLRAQEEQISLHGNILIPAMGDITHQLEDKLRIEQLHHANLPPEKEVRQHSRKILIPLNLTKAHHWVGIVIQFNDSNQVEVINYIDSLSHTKIPTKLKRRLQHIYGKDTKIINKRGMLQTDNTGCGPLVIENLMQSTQNSLSKEVVTKEKMQTIRNKHLRLAKKYLPLKPRTPTTMYGGGSGGDTSDEDEDKYKSTDSNDESSNSTTGNNSEEYSSSAEDEWVNPLQFFISNPHKDWQLLYDANGVYRHLTNPDRQETPLHHLVLEEDASSIATYPNIQAEINQRDFLEETPLHNAAYKGNAEIMTLLLENGGNPNILNEEELSPLHIALIQQNLTMIKVLFEHEANFLSSHSGYSITELLDNPFQQLRSSNELEEFILKLIELLNYGYG